MREKRQIELPSTCPWATGRKSTEEKASSDPVWLNREFFVSRQPLILEMVAPRDKTYTPDRHEQDTEDGDARVRDDETPSSEGYR